MPEMNKLDSLRVEEQDAYKRKQGAYHRAREAKDRCNAAYKAMQLADAERAQAQENLERAFQQLYHVDESDHSVGAEYCRIYDYYSPKIDDLRRQGNIEHYAMWDCFGKAAECFKTGDGAGAQHGSFKGRTRQKRRDNLQKQEKEYLDKLKAVQKEAYQDVPTDKLAAYQKAQQDYTQAKQRRASAHAEFQRIRAERNSLQDRFDALNAKYLQISRQRQKAQLGQT